MFFNFVINSSNRAVEKHMQTFVHREKKKVSFVHVISVLHSAGVV